MRESESAKGSEFADVPRAKFDVKCPNPKARFANSDCVKAMKDKEHNES